MIVITVPFKNNTEFITKPNNIERFRVQIKLAKCKLLASTLNHKRTEIKINMTKKKWQKRK